MSNHPRTTDHPIEIPRLVIAAPASGTGKTTIMVGLTKALTNLGFKVATFKCGPDYLDPTFHEKASGHSCRNLDGWIMGRSSVLRTFANGSRDADIALIEGVMGLYDGVSPTQNIGSTWEIALWLKAPIVLVVDGSGMARSIAALVQGFANFALSDSDQTSLAGVIANRVGGRSHTELLRKSLAPDFCLLGGLPKSLSVAFPERHLGLVSLRASIGQAQGADEHQNKIDRLGTLCQESIDLEQLLVAARQAPKLPIEDEVTKQSHKIPHTSIKCRIGIARDEAFDFYYDENLDALVQNGAELVPFSPIRDRFLPEVQGLYIGGGYPELYGQYLSENVHLREAICQFGASGKPIYGECGGFMYLTESITDREGKVWPMVGLIPTQVAMHDKLMALGYVEVETQEASLLGPQGTRFRGHQFRYSDLKVTPPDGIYKIRRRRDDQTQREGYRRFNVLGTYVHAHWASNPTIPRYFVNFCCQAL